VRQAVARFERMIPAGEVELSLAVESTARVKHDRHAVSSIVLNLLVNAYKYGRPPKEIRVSVRDEEGGRGVGSPQAGGRRVVIAVEDNGIGVPRGELRRIFEPFYRVEQRGPSTPSGAGLGLALVRHLARAQDGQAYVESEEGQGSRFSVALPAVPEEGIG
jgi:signal transduction histidine kinase